MDNSVKVHVRNLRALLIEVFKSLNHINPEFMWALFECKSMRMKLRSGKTLTLPPAKTQKFGIDSLVFRGSLLWNTLPNTLKSAKNLTDFKLKIRSWVGENCSCRLCK